MLVKATKFILAIFLSLFLAGQSAAWQGDGNSGDSDAGEVGDWGDWDDWDDDDGGNDSPGEDSDEHGE